MNSQKKTDLYQAFQLFFTPVLLILLGLVLFFRPDSASALIGRILGWLLVLGAVTLGAWAVMTKTNLAVKVIPSVCCAVLGGWLLNHPLAVAESIGRVIGILLVIRGIQDAAENGRRRGFPMAVVTILIGAILVLLPMTTSRLVFSLCGAAVLVVGIVMLLERLGIRRHSSGRDDPDIIDAL